MSQPEPLNPKSPYYELAKKYNLKIDFKPFIQVEGVTLKEFRRQKINILDFSAYVFTSKPGLIIFRICGELLYAYLKDEIFAIRKCMLLPPKYIYTGKEDFSENQSFGFDEVMVSIRMKISCSPYPKSRNTPTLNKHNIKHTIGTFYRTVSSDFSDMKDFDYDMLVFYSPVGVKSLKENFPGFVQGDIKMAAFGPTTASAVTQEGYRLDIQAPNPEAPSMTMALDNFLKEHNKSTK